MFNVTDRATLNGILERTDAYATGSGFLDSQSVNGITVIPLEDNLDNKMVYVKREEMDLSPVAEKFVEVMVEYFDQKEVRNEEKNYGSSSNRAIGPTRSAGQMVCGEEHSTGCRQVFYSPCGQSDLSSKHRCSFFAS